MCRLPHLKNSSSSILGPSSSKFPSFFKRYAIVALEGLAGVLMRRSYSSVTEIGLTMFAASLVALRPLLTFLRNKGTRGSSGDGGYPSHNKSWTRGLREVNPPIPLQDFPGSDTESQRNILPRSERSIKETTVNIKYTETGEA